jgi:3-methyladenine DNA glycosylase AlkD
MLHHEIHEFRLSAFIALVEKFKKCKEVDSQKEIVDFYVSHGTCANNWDLVDLSAPYILGRYMVKNPMPQLLDKMSIDTNLWVQRIAIVSTLMLIRNNMFNDTLRLAQRYLSHPHPLIHKATGWMLREIGKRNETILLEFLDTHAPKMPRTALRYAIERLSSEQKQMYMQRK